MKKQYHPHDFEEPNKHQHYACLGKCEFEIIATYIISRCQLEGKWVPINVFPTNLLGEPAELDYRLKQMMLAGKLEQTTEGFVLTQHCLEQIAEKYLMKK